MAVDLDQPNIIVPLISILSDHKKGMYKYICPWLFFALLSTVFLNELVTWEGRTCLVELFSKMSVNLHSNF